LQNYQVNRAQDRSLASSLSNNLFLNRTLQFNVDLEKAIEKLTVAQINDVMKKYLDINKITIVKAGDWNKK
jgi:zinc protease